MPKKADREHISRNEQIRRFIKKGLTVDGYAEDIDFIASIIRQEFTAVYHIGHQGGGGAADKPAGKNADEVRQDGRRRIFLTDKGIDECNP